MDESESKKENRNGEKRRFDPEVLKKGLRCDLDQYEMLKRYSEKKDMTEWNKWRLSNPGEDIFLQGANLNAFYLQVADLRKANLQGAGLLGADLQRAGLLEANLQGANLVGAKLQGIVLWGVNLKGVNFLKANLQGAELNVAKLQSANLMGAKLQDADFTGAELQGADFSRAIVDGGTLIWTYEIDHETKFEGVGLDAARIYPRTKQLLEYNIRRMNWEEWYKWKDWFKYLPKEERNKLTQFFLRNTVGWFWSISNYGLSTWRIIAVFVGLVIVFSSIYYICGMIAPPGIVDYLFLDGNGVEVAWWLVPIRAIHFSVVVMTVGFTNMHANAHSVWAHIFVSLQMILGFVLLGALVTRFAVLFTAGGPAGRFADEKEKTSKIS